MSDENELKPDEENLEDDANDEEMPKFASNPQIENIIRAIRKNEKSKNKNEYIKINYKVLIDKKTKLIAPFVSLLGTAVIAIVTYMRHFETGRWIIVVFSCLVLFLLFGSILQNMVEKFEIEVVKNEINIRLEAMRKYEEMQKQKEEEEQRAAMEKARKKKNQEDDFDQENIEN